MLSLKQIQHSNLFAKFLEPHESLEAVDRIEGLLHLADANK